MKAVARLLGAVALASIAIATPAAAQDATDGLLLKLKARQMFCRNTLKKKMRKPERFNLKCSKLKFKLKFFSYCRKILNYMLKLKVAQFLFNLPLKLI